MNLQFRKKSGIKRKNPERPIGARDNRGSALLYLQLEESVQKDPLWIPGARNLQSQSWVESGKIKEGREPPLASRAGGGARGLHATGRKAATVERRPDQIPLVPFVRVHGGGLRCKSGEVPEESGSRGV